jgi:hypothetical protein
MAAVKAIFFITAGRIRIEFPGASGTFMIFHVVKYKFLK